MDAAAGGGDCDDGDSRVHPGADEWCDAVDWNCDGEPYDGRACGKPQDLDALAAGTWDGDTGVDWQKGGVFLGDLDGDGTDDLGLVGSGASPDTPEGAYGGVYYVPGGQPLSFGMSHTETAAAWWHGSYDHTSLGTPHAAGDVDADGHPDLWLLGGDGVGAAALLLGPPGRWGVGQDFTQAGDVVWYGEAYRDGFANSEAAAGVDFDQDGFADAAFFSQMDGEDWSLGGGAVYLLHGGAGLPETPARSAADAVRLDCETPYDLAAGDITGDGLPDLLVGRAGVREVPIVDGADLAGADGLSCVALAGTTLVAATDDARSSALGHGVAVVGDWNGDGTDDWAVGDWARSVDYTWEGAIYLFAGAPGATAAGGRVADESAYASFLGGAEDVNLGYAHVEALRDLDGDALPDLGSSRIADLGGGEQIAALVLPSGAYDGLNQPLPARTLVLAGGDDESVAHKAPSSGDFDGDGVNDLVTGSEEWSLPLGRAYLVLGGEIPWDDPSVW